MPIPFIIGAAALASAAAGAKKGHDAKKKREKAQKIVSDHENLLNKKIKETELRGQELNKNLEKYAKYKLNIFNTHIKNLLEILSHCKDKVSSQFDSKTLKLTPAEYKNLEKAVINSLEITSGLAKGIASGTLSAMGAYGSVGMLASASTGTAISTLSGAAATNATLAWLGGGALSAGGFGMVGGMAVLGGVVAGPLIAVTGFVLDSKAEKCLSDANDYAYNVIMEIEKMDFTIQSMEVTEQRIKELISVTDGFIHKFEPIHEKLTKSNISNICEQKEEIAKLITLGKSIKNLLDISLLNELGENNKNFEEEIEIIKLEFTKDN